MSWQIITADVLAGLATLPDASVQTVITSPPYWGLRDYGTATWEGGDAACDHLRDVRQHKDGCLGCGCPMQERTPGCRWCADRHVKRGLNGTPEGRSYEAPSETIWERPRSRSKVTEAALPFKERCGKCHAVRIDSQLGLEPTPEAYVERLVGVFREVRRVLRKDGTAWVNLGDSYWNGGAEKRDGGHGFVDGGKPKLDAAKGSLLQGTSTSALGLKPKDLVGIPWRVAFALQADGWYLRSDVIWSKPNPMPESVTDRPTKAHEYMFLLTRSARYFYDADAVREAATARPQNRYTSVGDQPGGQDRIAAGGHNPMSQGGAPTKRDKQRMTGAARIHGGDTYSGFNERWDAAEAENGTPMARNMRSVWSIPTEPFPEAHFATFPKALVVPCVKAGTSEKGCCPECGAAFVRVERTTEYDHTTTADGKTKIGPYAAQSGNGEGTHDIRHGVYSRSETKGWAPSCTHHEAGVVPCTVLDPFAGSGTVGVVALRYGRSFVGIELNPTYAEMARERIRNDAPLWNHAAEVV